MERFPAAVFQKLQLVAHAHSEPFGRRIDADGKALDVAKGEVKHGFTGHRHDDELGLIDMRGRLYDPNLRRFLTPDPLVTDPLWGQSYNRYSYVMNDPVNLVDPTGLYWKRVTLTDGSTAVAEYDDKTGDLINVHGLGETIHVGAPPDAPSSGEGGPPPPPVGSEERGNLGFKSSWALFVQAGDKYFEQGVGSSVGDDYSGAGDTLAATLERGVLLLDLTGAKPTPGLVRGSMMGDDPVIVPNFKWSAGLTRDFYNSLDLGGLERHAGNHGEAFTLDLRAAMDIALLVPTVAVECGIGAAMVLGVKLPKLGRGATGSGAATGGRASITSGSQVTEQVIREAMKDAPLVSQKSGGILLPLVQRYVDRLVAGEAAPVIRVDGKIVVDGNHRYVAGRVYGQEPSIQPWAGGSPSRVISWDRILISPNEW